MIAGIRQKAVVGEGGKIQISAPDLPRGAVVDVIVLLESRRQDTTGYLLSTDANRDHLQRALRELDDPAGYVYVDPDQE